MHTVTVPRQHSFVALCSLCVALAALLLAGGAPGPLVGPTPVAAAGPDTVVNCSHSGECVPMPLPPAAPPAPRGLGPRVAMTFTVNATGEPATGTDATCAATCTLRQAINASNANAPGAGTNTITFAPATFGVAQTITLLARRGLARCADTAGGDHGAGCGAADP